MILVTSEIDGTQNSKYRLYDILGRQIGQTVTLSNIQATSSEWSPNGEFAIIGLANSAVCLVSPDSTKLSTVTIAGENKYLVPGGVYSIEWTEKLSIAMSNGEGDS